MNTAAVKHCSAQKIFMFALGCCCMVLPEYQYHAIVWFGRIMMFDVVDAMKIMNIAVVCFVRFNDDECMLLLLNPVARNPRFVQTCMSRVDLVHEVA
jgi:hypothetical protein